MSISHRTVILVLVLSGALGCVTSSTHDRVLGERDTIRSQAAALEERVATLEATKSSLSAELSNSKEKVSDLTGTYDSLLEQLQTEIAAGQIEILQMRDGIRLSVADEVLFESGSADVDAGGRLILRKVASQLVGLPNPIRVDGHTDDVPIQGALASRYASNWELAGARAISVVRLLQENGVSGTRMQAVSSGEYAPRVANDSNESRGKNRRIEIRLMPIPENAAPAGEELAEGEPAIEKATSTNPARPAES